MDKTFYADSAVYSSESSKNLIQKISCDGDYMVQYSYEHVCNNNRWMDDVSFYKYKNQYYKIITDGSNNMSRASVVSLADIKSDILSVQQQMHFNKDRQQSGYVLLKDYTQESKLVPKVSQTRPGTSIAINGEELNSSNLRQDSRLLVAGRNAFYIDFL